MEIFSIDKRCTVDGWLNLLERDASAEEFALWGARLAADGHGQAEDVATALRLKLLLQQRAQRAHELSTLNDIARRLSSLHAPDGLLAEVVDQARRLLRVDLAYLGLVEHDPDPAMRISVASGALRPGLVGLAVDLSASLAGEVVRAAEPLWVSDYATAAAFRHDDGADRVATAENMRGLLGVPLVVRGDVIGALFACKRSERRFTDDEIVLLSGLAAHAAIAIDNARSMARLAAARDELMRRTAELERAAAWTERLTELVLRGGGVDELLHEIASAVEAPVRFLRHDEGAVEGYARPVTAGRRDFGTLVLPDAEPAREDVLIVDQAVPVLALALVAEEAVTEAVRHAQDALLVELLESSAEGAAARSLVRRAGLDPSAKYTIVAVDHRTADAAPVTWPPGTRTTEVEGRFVAVVPARADAVRALWSAGLPSAGIAGPVTGATGWASAHREAVATADALGVLGLVGEARSADELGVFRVLLSHAGRDDLDAQSRRVLGSLIAEEERRGIPLSATLERFLDEAQRPGTTARALGIHVNTLYQRLALLDTVLGDGWRGTARALELQLLPRLRRAGQPTA